MILRAKIMVDCTLMTSRREMLADEQGAHSEADDAARPKTACEEEEGLVKLTGTMKWFDATRGFGFLVSDAAKSDVLVHFSVLKEHDRRSLPEGAVVDCLVAEQERGLQARRILSIDLSKAVPPELGRARSSGDRIDPSALMDE